MNKYIVTGNLTRDPEAKVLDSNGKKVTVTNFTIASSRPFKRKDGTPDQETLFIDAEAWDTGAETIAKYFTKGSKILAEGSLRNETWNDKDGNKRSKIKLRVSHFEFFSTKGESTRVAVGEGEGEPDSVAADVGAEEPTPF